MLWLEGLLMLWLERVTYKLWGSSLVWKDLRYPEDTSLYSISYMDVQVLTEWNVSDSGQMQSNWKV